MGVTREEDEWRATGEMVQEDPTTFKQKCRGRWEGYSGASVGSASTGSSQPLANPSHASVPSDIASPKRATCATNPCPPHPQNTCKTGLPRLPPGGAGDAAHGGPLEDKVLQRAIVRLLQPI